MSKPIGRILTSNHRSARAEFTENVVEGMLVSVELKSARKRYVGRIEKVESTKTMGLTGYILWLDYIDRGIRSFTEIYIAHEEFEKGILHVGNDTRSLPVKLRVNPLFGHMMVAGMTTSGKTHLLLILCEELGQHKVPCLVIDPQGEMVNLPVVDRERCIVVEDLRIENLIAHMQQRKIVVYNLLGITRKAKVQRIAELLTEIMLAKEKDYMQANENPMLLEIPPMLIIMDEGDIFAPNQRFAKDAPREAVGPTVDILERGAKFGLGAIVATQRPTRLDVDVRSQCNSAALFRMIDAGSLQAVNTIDYIPQRDKERVRGLVQGQCILAGNIVMRPRMILTRDIVTPRAKTRDFEKMLGIEDISEELFESQLEIDEIGAVVNRETGEVVHDALDRLTVKDQGAFENAEGDGVVLRSHISPEEQRLLNQMRKPDKKGERLIG